MREKKEVWEMLWGKEGKQTSWESVVALLTSVEGLLTVQHHTLCESNLKVLNVMEGFFFLINNIQFQSASTEQQEFGRNK